jgi:hypothetical protein
LGAAQEGQSANYLIEQMVAGGDWALDAQESAEIDAVLAERERTAGKAGGYL